jgi:hypothetical protein
MRQGKVLLAGILTASAIATTLLSVNLRANSKVLAQNERPEQTKKWQALVPIDEVAEPVDTHKRTLRQNKNRRYNSTRSDQSLMDQPHDVIYGRIDESRRPSALPIGESDAVILGTVIEVQPYLTENKTSIYTEFRIRVEETFKFEVPGYLMGDREVLADQEGGALRLKDGRTLRYFVGGTSKLPSLKRRYVLFLSLTHNNQDLAILTGYELRNGAVISLEEGGDKSPYANFAELKFLGLLRNATAQRSDFFEIIRTQ